MAVSVCVLGMHVLSGNLSTEECCGRASSLRTRTTTSFPSVDIRPQERRNKGLASKLKFQAIVGGLRVGGRDMELGRFSCRRRVRVNAIEEKHNIFNALTSTDDSSLSQSISSDANNSTSDTAAPYSWRSHGTSGFKAAGMYAGLRASGQKPDLALVFCEDDAVAAGTFTKNLMAGAPVVYCKQVLAKSQTARAVLINAGQANAATVSLVPFCQQHPSPQSQFLGDTGYQDTLECVEAVAKLLGVDDGAVLIDSTRSSNQKGEIARPVCVPLLKMSHTISTFDTGPLLDSLPKLVSSLSSSEEAPDAAAVAITTTDLVSKSVAIETKIGGTSVKLGGIAKGSGMIHLNMATMFGVVTTDASVNFDVWRSMVLTAVNRSFNLITVDGDTSTNDTLLGLASGKAGGPLIDTLDRREAQQLQSALDAVRVRSWHSLEMEWGGSK